MKNKMDDVVLGVFFGALGYIALYYLVELLWK